ncbi:MAG: TrbC/VirB2 family protein [Acidobacteria bacterium]|nr:TrbC/VirB2 family protein [Acidobacteriota bacterium]
MFGTGALLCASVLFAACPAHLFGLGLVVLGVGVLALFANVEWLPGLLRRRVFRGLIRMRRAGGRVHAAASALVAPLGADPVLLRRWATPVVALFVFVVAADVALQAGTSPWEIAVMKICNAFTTTIGRGLALVAVIIGGLMFAFGEGGSKSAIAGLIFGAGMVLGAPDFLMWVGLDKATGC